ncbi:MAG: RluA family pseudouridine synthase [Turneriella sp.]
MRIESKRISVPEQSHGLRLDIFLTSRFSDFSRNDWQKRIARRDITINGHSGRASRKLNFGDIIEFSYEMPDEPEVPTNLEVIFEDEDYLVVNKPPGLPVHPSGIYKTQTVTELLKSRGILKEGHLLHRLDRETSGVLALGKNREAAAAFQKILRSGRVEKFYQVAVEGIISEELDARGYIYRVPTSRLSRKRSFSRSQPTGEVLDVQTAWTEFFPVMSHQGLTLLRARLHTGRMHQIRATLYALGFPVVGDKLYGPDENLYFHFADDVMSDADWASLRIPRSALHCSEMILNHPRTGLRWNLKAALPADIMSLFFHG